MTVSHKVSARFLCHFDAFWANLTEIYAQSSTPLRGVDEQSLARRGAQ